MSGFREALKKTSLRRAFYEYSIILFTTRQLADEWPVENLLQYLIEEPYIIDEIEIYITLKSGGVAIGNKMLLKDAIRFADSTLAEVREKSGTVSSVYSKLSIVKSLIQIAHNLEMDVIAEGVETEEQAKILYDHGCTGTQGYWFYKPMSMRELEEKNILG